MLYVSANRSSQKVIEDWFCPTHTVTDFLFDGESSRSFDSVPPDHRKVSEEEDVDNDEDGDEEDNDHIDRDNDGAGQKRHDSYADDKDDNDAEMASCVVVVCSCLLMSLLAVGILSYFRAVKR